MNQETIMTTRKTFIGMASLAVGAAAVPSKAGAQQKTIRFAYQNNLFMAPVFVAFSKNWFDEALGKVGYKMEPHQMNIGPAVAEAMASGRLDMGQLGLAVIVTSAGRGLPAKIVVNTGVSGEGVVVRSDSGITKMSQLKGKTIAIPAKGNMQDFIVRLGLEKAGLDPSKDVHFVEIAAPDQKQALHAKLVDAITLFEPLTADALLSGNRLLASGQEIYPGHENDSICASDDAIKKDPEAVRAVVQTVVRAQQWVMDNPAEAKVISAKALGFSEATIDQAWKDVFRRRDGRPSVETVQRFADFLHQWGYIPNALKASSIIDDEFLPKG